MLHFWSVTFLFSTFAHPSATGGSVYGLVSFNKVIRPKSRVSALSEKSGRQIDEQTKTSKKTFELAKKNLKNNFVTNQWTNGWTDQQMDKQMEGQTVQKVAYRGVGMP